MPRRLGLPVAVVGLCAAVAVATWWQSRDNQISAVVPLPQARRDLKFESSDVPTDPGAAVAAILELRSRFGSVLTNSELDTAEPANDLAGGPNSFDEFLWEAAGVRPPPTTEKDVKPHTLERASPTADGELAQSLHEIATRLVQRAQQAQDTGDVAQRQRFSGLATLLRAEADALTRPPAAAEH